MSDIICHFCGKCYKNTRGLQSHISKYHRNEKVVVPKNTIVCNDTFGGEVIEPMLSRLSLDQLRTLLLYPDDAISVDLPNLIWFNLDYPDNHTVRSATHHQSKALLEVSLHHFRKVLSVSYGAYAFFSLTPVEQAMIREYVRILSEGKEVTVSRFCPYYGLIDGGLISTEQITRDLVRNVHENCQLPVEDWVRTNDYASTYLE